MSCLISYTYDAFNMKSKYFQWPVKRCISKFIHNDLTVQPKRWSYNTAIHKTRFSFGWVHSSNMRHNNIFGYSFYHNSWLQKRIPQNFSPFIHLLNDKVHNSGLSVDLLMHFKVFQCPLCHAIAEKATLTLKCLWREIRTKIHNYKCISCKLPIPFNACCSSRVKLDRGTLSDTGRTATVARLATVGLGSTFGCSEEEQQKADDN